MRQAHLNGFLRHASGIKSRGTKTFNRCKHNIGVDVLGVYTVQDTHYSICVDDAYPE